MKLNLGCGPDYRDGYVNIDGKATIKADIHMEIDGESLAQRFEPDSVTEVLCKDFLEHQFSWEGKEILSALHVIMKTGAKMMIQVPNVKRIINDRDMPVQEKIRQLYGGQFSAGPENQRYHCHKYGYSIESLQNMLNGLRFKDVRMEDKPRCIRAYCFK